MKNTELDPLFQKYAESVIRRMRSDDLLTQFQDCSQLLLSHVHEMPAWQIALPVFSCLAAGGSPDAGLILANAWYPIYLASEILDSVEDKEFIPDRWMPSPEVGTNLATSLIFTTFHSLTLLPDPDRVSRVARIFSRSGFDATYGQHRDLTKIPSSVEESLNDYWEMIILKSGSVFRMATAGGAAAGTSDETVVEALGDYGTALGVMLQLVDDCRDAFTESQEAMNWEISLPLLLYLMTSEEENIIFPKVNSRAEWGDLLRKTGVTNAIASLLLEWKSRALVSLEPLRMSREKLILERIPSLLLERIPVYSKEVSDGNPD